MTQPANQRPIPAQLWNEIGRLNRAARLAGGLPWEAPRTANQLRQAIAQAAAKHGFTVTELEQRGLVEPATKNSSPEHRQKTDHGLKCHVGRSRHEQAR